MHSSPRLAPALALAAACLFALASCGGDGDEASAEVASLQASGDAAGDAANAAVRTDGADDLEPDEAALEFSQCMRDEGLDFPDLSVDAEGNIELRSAFQEVDPSADGFREAFEGCGEILQQSGFGGRRAAAESPEVEDALLEFSQCLRAEGHDVGDLTLGQGPGGGGPGADGSPTEGQNGANADGDGNGQGGDQGQTGARGPGFGNRGARFAQQLGLDYEDPTVQEAIDGCMTVIDEAFTAAGVGQPGGS